MQLLDSTRQQLFTLPLTFTNKVFDFAEETVDYYLPEIEKAAEEPEVAHHEDSVSVKTYLLRATDTNLHLVSLHSA